MALTETTLASACTASATKIVVASAGTIAKGDLVRVDGEMMQVTKAYVAASTTVPVLRGQDGGVPVAHPVTAAVEYAPPDDSEWGSQSPGVSAQYPFQIPTVIRSYSASGAITLPEPGQNMKVVLNAVSTTVLEMTLAAPTRAMDGCKLSIRSRNGTGAHTIDFSGGLNGAGSSYNLFTFPAGPVQIEVEAWDLFWYINVAPAMTGTVTLLTGGIA